VAGRLGSFGSRILWYQDISSTNDVAAALADADAGEGTLVMADAQSAGRGRLGRRWASPPGSGIYATVVLRPGTPAVPLLTLGAGLAIAEGIEAATALPARVKWPNDVLIDGSGDGVGRKVAGILAEGGTSRLGAAWVVLGFGINVLPAAYPPEIAARATSLEAESGRPIDRGLVLAECLARLSARYADLRERRGGAVAAAWRVRAASTMGRTVQWEAGGVPQRGTARDIDGDGALLVATPSGITRIISGEVRWT
jgi:BirA family biotin operon repressor/biotin-[acetyl-CoA-carboxylase] ligase